MIALLTLFARFGRAVRRGLKEPEFRGLFYLTAVVVASGTWFYSAVEKWSVADSLYFSVITLTTVGYGDLAPSTRLSRVFTVVFILIGIGLIIAVIERIAHYAGEDHRARAARRSRGRGETEG